MEFEVASVKPAELGTPFTTSVPLNGLDGPGPNSTLFSASAPLMAYLLFAYKISDSNQGRAIYDKLPAWAKTQFYTIQARAGSVPTRDQLRLMVQALLADRFSLAIHRETQMREQYAFSLVQPGRLGPQLRPHPAGEPCVDNPDRPAVIAAPDKDSDVPRTCGFVSWDVAGQRHVRMIDVTMTEAVNYLSSAAMAGGTLLPHTGIDGTGLAGRYDLDLQFLSEPDGPGSNTSADGATFTRALKDQLGLKLSERKGPVEIIVIDHLEKPSAD
jgi:bla regulator protein blaR1